MKRTDSLRRQHKELLQIAAELSLHLHVDKLSKDVTKVHIVLAQLFGKLKVHLTVEDEILYPGLLNHSNQAIKDMASRYVTQMGGIAEALQSYKKKWMDPAFIQKSPDIFIHETQEILKALAKRIEMENNELYPTLDDL